MYIIAKSIFRLIVELFVLFALYPLVHSIVQTLGIGWLIFPFALIVGLSIGQYGKLFFESLDEIN